MDSPLQKAFADAIYPQLRGTGDSRLRAEAMRRTRRAIAALAAAGFEIVPRTETAQKQQTPTETNVNEQRT